MPTLFRSDSALLNIQCVAVIKRSIIANILSVSYVSLMTVLTTISKTKKVKISSATNHSHHGNLCAVGFNSSSRGQRIYRNCGR